jgi:hypothetical protein
LAIGQSPNLLRIDDANGRFVEQQEADMDTRKVETRALSDDELDAVSGGEPISQAVGLMVSLGPRNYWRDQ